MAEVVFEEIRVYVTRRQNMVAHYIATRPIMDLCERSVLRLCVWVSWRWWYQEGLDIEGTKEIAVSDSDGEEAQCKDRVAQEDMPCRDRGWGVLK